MAIPDSVLAEIDELILPLGFDRRKTLYRRRDGNIAVLHLSGRSWDQDFISFTAHLGVLSERLSRVFGPRMSFSVPGIPNTHHWYRWAGDLNVPDQPTSMWGVPRSNGAWDLREVRRQISGAVMPALEAHSSDEGLRDDWLVHRDTWISEAEQLAYMIVLIRDLGPVDKVPGLQQRLRYLLASGDEGALKVADSGVLDWKPKD